jgi:DNA-binding MarR family transcriptional regulator
MIANNKYCHRQLTGAAMERRIVDYILELKAECSFEEEIGGACELSSPEVRCIGALRPGEAVTAGDLAARLGLSPSRASRVITGVRERGLLSEGLDTRDRRAVAISLTPEGERMRGRIDRKKGECEERLLSRMGREGSARCGRGWRVCCPQ